MSKTYEEGEAAAVNRKAAIPIQLTWQDIVIKAHPPKGKCCKGRGALTEEKTIINNVSGTVLPGQFLAIIGASGKLNTHRITWTL